MGRIDVDTTGEYAAYGDVKVVMSVEQFEAIGEFLRTAQHSTPATADFVEAYEAVREELRK